jgi:histidine triad (HIT) family protein
MTGSLQVVKSGAIEGEVLVTEPNCPFCPANGTIEIVRDIGGLYLARVKDMATMQDRPDRWLIIPADHCESLEDLPLGWGEMLVELVHEANLSSGLNLSLNIGSRAGQTVPHLHWWVLDRSTDDLGKGMDWMITELARLYRINRDQQGEIDRLTKALNAPKDRDALLA